MALLKAEILILVRNFSHLASLVWAKLILGRFRDAVLPDFLVFLLVLTITLRRFSLTPAMGDIAVDMPQGHRICVRVFKKKKKISNPAISNFNLRISTS